MSHPPVAIPLPVLSREGDKNSGKSFFFTAIIVFGIYITDGVWGVFVVAVGGAMAVAVTMASIFVYEESPMVNMVLKSSAMGFLSFKKDFVAQYRLLPCMQQRYPRRSQPAYEKEAQPEDF